MSSQTTNLHLTKPSGNEAVDIDVINANMDIIDAAVGDVDVAQDGSLQSQVAALQGSVPRFYKQGWGTTLSISNAPSGTSGLVWKGADDIYLIVISGGVVYKKLIAGNDSLTFSISGNSLTITASSNSLIVATLTN